MWNAGVVAIAKSNDVNATLTQALEACDSMCADQMERKLIEQFSLSLALQANPMNEGKQWFNAFGGAGYKLELATPGNGRALDVRSAFHYAYTGITPGKVISSNSGSHHTRRACRIYKITYASAFKQSTTVRQTRRNS